MRWYLILTFGSTWGWIAVAWAVGWSMGNPLAQLPMAFAPAVAAFVVRKYVTREGFADAGLRVRVPVRWYAVAWLVPIAVLAGIMALAAVFAGYRPAGFGVIAAFAGIALLVPPIFFGEEFGWRGYLQQRIHPNPTTAILVTGVIWAVWHWPLAFAGYSDYDNIPLGLATWGAHTTLMAILLGWLFVKTASVWVTSLAHGCSNMVVGVAGEILLVEDGGLDRAVVDALTLVPMLAVAVAILASGHLRQQPVENTV
ncbi:CPBP family intramembrane glutamic endopeptidase [Cryptosporangium sp. NPDC048952]|uniref:CPBP family intramembrane glutamic endopeptidase n=1 Tax=Cryptosporangium sp. NPDC048952 TaxID=3363961 RepID=UPI0037107430